MGFGIVGHFWKPCAGHHQARRIDRPPLQSFDGSSIHRVGLAQIVCVDYEELCAGRISQPLHQSLGQDPGRETGQQGAEQYYSQDQRRSHCRLVNHTPSLPHHASPFPDPATLGTPAPAGTGDSVEPVLRPTSSTHVNPAICSPRGQAITKRARERRSKSLVFRRHCFSATVATRIADASADEGTRKSGFSTIHLTTWRGVVLEGCHAEAAKILTWRCL